VRATSRSTMVRRLITWASPTPHLPS